MRTGRPLGPCRACASDSTILGITLSLRSRAAGAVLIRQATRQRNRGFRLRRREAFHGQFRKLDQNPSLVGAGFRFRIDRRAPEPHARRRVYGFTRFAAACLSRPDRNIGSNLRSAPGAPSRGRSEGPVMPASRLSLDGTWEFLHVSDDRPSGPAEVRSITVPAPWQAQCADLRMRAGIGIYRRLIDIPAEWLTDHVWLRFGAVFHNSRVWVNGALAGTNEGGFLPFSFDVTQHLRPGENEIKVRVDSPTDNPAEFPDSPFAEIPFGKQSWYGPLSGIWQPVYLERRVVDHITRVRLVPNLESGRVTAGAFFAKAPTQFSEVRIEVRDPEGAVALELSRPVQPGVTSLPFDFAVEDVRAWSPA